MNNLPFHINPFKFWVQQALPTVFDDSLSYTEVLNKIAYTLNEVIKTSNMVNSNLLNEYDVNKHYEVDDYVWYNDGIYTCIEDTYGQFNTNCWRKVTDEGGSFIYSVGVDVKNCKAVVASAIGVFEEALLNTMNSIAPIYDTEKVDGYSVGDYVTHNGTIYVCQRNTSGTFKSADWQSIVLVDNLRSYVEELVTNEVGLNEEFTGSGLEGITQNSLVQILEKLNSFPVLLFKGVDSASFAWNGYECSINHSGDANSQVVCSLEDTEIFTPGNNYVVYIENDNTTKVSLSITWVDNESQTISEVELTETAEITVPADTAGAVITLNCDNGVYESKFFGVVLNKNNTNNKLKGLVDSISDNIDEIESDIDGAQQDILDIKNALEAIDGDITDIEGDIVDIEGDIGDINSAITGINSNCLQYRGTIDASTNIDTLMDIGFWSIPATLTHAQNSSLPEYLSTGRNYLICYKGSGSVRYQSIYNTSKGQIWTRYYGTFTVSGSYVTTWIPNPDYPSLNTGYKGSKWWAILLPSDTSLTESGRFADAATVGGFITDLTSRIGLVESKGFFNNGSASNTDLNTLIIKGYWTIGAATSANGTNFPNEKGGRRYVYNYTYDSTYSTVTFQHFVNLTTGEVWWRTGETVGGNTTWHNGGLWQNLISHEINNNLLHYYFTPNSKRLNFSKGKMWDYMWNTAEAVKEACKDPNCDIVSFDVRPTSDHYFVSFHNQSFGSNYVYPVNANSSVEQSTLAEVSNYKYRKGVWQITHPSTTYAFNNVPQEYNSETGVYYKNDVVTRTIQVDNVDVVYVYRALEDAQPIAEPGQTQQPAGEFNPLIWHKLDTNIANVEDLLKICRKYGKTVMLEMKSKNTNAVGNFSNEDMTGLYNLVKNLRMLDSVIFMGNATACDYYASNHKDAFVCYFSQNMTINLMSAHKYPNGIYMGENDSITTGSDSLMEYCINNNIKIGSYSERANITEEAQKEVDEEQYNKNLDFVSVHTSPD